MKSQVVIIQFVIYATISFFLFILITNMFDISSIRVKKDLSAKYSSYILKILEAYAINLLVNCRDCYFETIVSFKNITKQNFYIKIDEYSNLIVEH
ncbi:MAG: hypothetical protein RMJ17_04145, partial [Candidatus Aenigmarchaeota archaeon]|nr:hypothetical protein [Candidatus Aenigmarchaeota archaeon]MDW8149748.1 hypothetical protein [Candidatus Aenigmarchaeota archaeon]